MKTLLAILCIIMLLFGGGCAVTLVAFLGGDSSGAGVLVLIPLAVFLFNALVLVALFGWSDPWLPAFYILAIVDFVVAGTTGVAFFMTAVNDPSVMPWAVLMVGGFALKGWLTWAYVQGLDPQDPAA